MASLSNQTVLVTGGTRGIGRGIAERFADEGATVAVNHRPTDESRERAERVVDTIDDAGNEAFPVAGDVRSPESVRRMVETVNDRFGYVDVLVNNAGTHDVSRFESMSVDAWDEILAVNLRGTFLTSRFVVPGMLEAGSGKVINMASEFGVVGEPFAVHYSAAKGGIIALTRALARELAPEVNVNAIAPGPIETDMLDASTAAWREKKLDRLPLNRFGDVEDVVPTALFLASDESSYYTGQVLSPDGGSTMR